MNLCHTRPTALIIIFVLMSPALGCYNPARHNMESMIQRAQKQFSPSELQSAVVSVCTTNNGDFIPDQNLPHEILSLSDAKPVAAYVTANAQGNGTLVVIWGGMEGWGVGVCPPGGLLDTNMDAHVWRWSDGVFFFWGKN